MPSNRRDYLAARIRAARTGLATSLPHGTKTLKVGDSVLTIAEIDQAFAVFEKLFDAAAAAHAALNARLDTRDAAKPAVRELLANFKVAIVALLGRTNEKLVDFGINPARPRKQGSRKSSQPAKQEKPAA